MLRAFLLLFVATLSFSSAHAVTLGDAQDALGSLPRTPRDLTPAQEKSCERTYAKIYSRGVLDIRVAIGYIDISEGQATKVAGEMRENGSIDAYLYKEMSRGLTGRCHGDMEACDFSQDHNGVFSKNVRGPDGGTTRVVLHLTHASASPDYHDNMTSLLSEQKEFTRQSEENFFGGLAQGAQVVLYLGHARGGGGPDFNPPRLLANGHPNYNGYYRVQHPGLNHMIHALSQAQEKPALIGIFACLSEKGFYSSLKQATPQTGTILTKDLFHTDEILNSAYGTIDAVLRKQCGSNFENSVKTDEFARQKVAIQGFFK
jgi:hypothetical protein